MSRPGHEILRRVEKLIESRIGFAGDPSRHRQLGEILERRIRENGCAGSAQYLELLESPRRGTLEVRALAEAITVGESYFFRCREQFTALADAVVPAWREANPAGGTMRILSAGCAGGEEPYTLALVVRDALMDRPDCGVSVLAVDLNAPLLARAEEGRFTEWSFRGVGELERTRFARKDGSHWEVDAALKALVRFEERNLATDDDGLWGNGAFDVVFCRNVLIYFSGQATVDLVRRIERALVPGGWLFLGTAETLRGTTNAFDLCHTHGSFYYRRRGAGSVDAGIPPDGALEIPAVGVAGDSWPADIAASSHHVRDLALAASASPGASEGLARPALAGEDAPDVLVARAAMLLELGDFPAAEAVGRRAMALDGLLPDAHYVVGLCRERSGDPDEALRLLEAAAYLDPEFAMPRLHLGRLARHRHRTDEARRQLEQARALLEQESPARLMRFGGGLGRGGLEGLIRSESKALSRRG